jgi:hypothetical protein
MSLQLIHEALYIPVQLGRFDVPQSKYQLSLLLPGVAPLMVAKVCYFHGWTAGDIALFKLLYCCNFLFVALFPFLGSRFPDYQRYQIASSLAQGLPDHISFGALFLPCARNQDPV